MQEEKPFSLFDYYVLTNQQNVLISYKGPISDIILAEISRDIRNKFASNPQVSRKLFSIYMELAQNILYYSAEKISFAGRKDSVGIIIITEYKNYYIFSCGNLVENEYIDELIESCEIINRMASDRNKLREYKRDQRSNPTNQRSKGAGIGLIQVVLTSGNPLKVEYKKINDHFSFFSLSVVINKTFEEVGVRNN
ncbi:MAG: SiaB family protein kinase [Microscillaceae bacterium]|nr:SiaB family protein kinase [Microscillaceae bacterium]MDW8461080.1 SiaB family protein kinase [Cytophagales bacterium]